MYLKQSNSMGTLYLAKQTKFFLKTWRAQRNMRNLVDC